MDTSSSIGIAVASKQLDATREQGQAINNLLEDAARVADASRGAVTATPGPTESGQTLDVLA